MSTSNFITSLANRAKELRQDYDTWQSKNTIQKLFAREKLNEEAWQQEVKDLFDYRMLEYLDNHPSFTNLRAVITELDKFKDLLNYDFLIFLWKEMKKRSSMAGENQRKFDELIDLQLERAENVKAMCIAINRLENRR